MKKRIENNSTIVLEEDLTANAELGSNGSVSYDAPQPSPENDESPRKDKSRVWRRITITMAIFATSLTMTFSWQKKVKEQKTEKVRTEQNVVIPPAVDVVTTDTLK
jgi:hypothetical protein